ncbi:hypothetical protein KIW84_022835 [Lathyrus oleraceus]|uniref:Retrovirus-related Pol polyprotein from transposon TNT 1-94-like beta-barrel domain-containing protein n=1 Tax=Pisum sativum TaxID=3888 RepID=A0A9D4YE20_PEA|nr:hypothetical protein KIW84_022835 [Pisum sativum]
MKIIAAYLLAVLGGNTAPSAVDVKRILGSVGVEGEDEQIELLKFWRSQYSDVLLQLLLREVKGKYFAELIASGREKLASVPSGGGVVAVSAVSGGGAAASAPPAKAKEEKKVEEKEESDDSILHDLRQDDRSVTKYFNTLNRHWQQLDVYDEVEWSCTEDKKKYKELVEKDRVYKFLLGLNTELDEVRGRILGTKPLPKIREAFSEIRRKESRRKVMLGKSSAVPSIEGSAMAARGDQCSFQKKTRPWCDHCKKSGHTKETYWIIHGKPSELKWTKNRDSRGNTVEVNSHSSPFNKEQMEALQKMLQQTIGTATVAQKGNLFHALNTSMGKQNSWIIDSGASDHMTGYLTVFDSYSPCQNNSTVRIADGTLSKVMGKGSVIISQNITLSSVLFWSRGGRLAMLKNVLDSISFRLKHLN